MTLWLRLYTEALHDPKVQRLSDKAFKGWINLLMLAKEHEGALPDVADIAFALRIADRQAAVIVSELKAVGLLDQTEVGLAPHNWDSRQYDSDDTAERVRRYRARKQDAKEAAEVTAGNVTGHVSENVPSDVSGNVREKRREEQTRAEPDKSREEPLPLHRPESAAADKLTNGLRALPGWPKTLALTTLQAKVETWQTVYSAVDISDELRCMDSWFLSHPQRKANVAFVENWLRKAAKDAREQPARLTANGAGHRGTGGQIWASVGVAGRTREDAEREYADAWDRAGRGEH
jgi:hypothetical protein